jgi:DNA mismatch repair protein MutH
MLPPLETFGVLLSPSGLSAILEFQESHVKALQGRLLWLRSQRDVAAPVLALRSRAQLRAVLAVCVL